MSNEPAVSPLQLPQPSPYASTSGEKDEPFAVTKGPRTGAYWLPVQLKPIFWAPFQTVLLLLAIGLEIAYFISRKNKGWVVRGNVDANHYAYTIPPVIFSMVVTKVWETTSREIQRIQPYVELSKGGATARRSILLDYADSGATTILRAALKNGHVIVTLASFLSLLGLSFNPLASALFVTGDVSKPAPQSQVTSLAKLGLNRDSRFEDLTVFLTAAGFSGATVQFSVPDPPFVFGSWTVAPFVPPTGLAGNGTVTAKTKGISSEANCVKGDITSTPTATGYSNAATFPRCRGVFDVDHNSTRLFGSSIPTCDDDSTIPIDQRRVVFWFFTYDTDLMAVATLCTPNVTVWDVTVTVDLASSNITSVIPSQLSSSGDPRAAVEPPWNGRAYNGIAFPAGVASLSRITQARQDATRLQLPAAVVQSAENAGVYTADRFVELTNKVYRTYMTILAKSIYFTPTSEIITVDVTTIEKHLFLSQAAVHFLAFALLTLSLVGTLVQLAHAFTRRNLRLTHEPGSIASSVAFGGETNLAKMLNRCTTDQDIAETLEGKTFTFNSSEMKILTESVEAPVTPALKQEFWKAYMAWARGSEATSGKA